MVWTWISNREPSCCWGDGANHHSACSLYWSMNYKHPLYQDFPHGTEHAICLQSVWLLMSAARRGKQQMTHWCGLIVQLWFFFLFFLSLSASGRAVVYVWRLHPQLVGVSFFLLNPPEMHLHHPTKEQRGQRMRSVCCVQDREPVNISRATTVTETAAGEVDFFFFSPQLGYIFNMFNSLD